MNEPVTVLTNIMLLVGSIVWGERLLRHGVSREQEWTTVMMWSFVFAGLAAGFGAFNHGFLSDPGLKRGIWIMTLGSIAGAFTVLSVASIGVFATTQRQKNRTVDILISMWGIFFFTLILAYDIRVVILYLALNLALSAFSQGIRLFLGQPGAGWMLGGTGLMLFGLVVQQAMRPLATNFTQNDVCHLIFFVGMYCLYRGSKQLRAT